MMSVLLVSMLACTPTPSSTDPMAGAGDAEPDIVVAADLAADVGTVVEVTWQGVGDLAGVPVEDARLVIEDGEGEEWEQDITTGRATVWGLAPESDVRLTVLLSVDGEELVSPTRTVTTGPVDSDLPSVDLSGGDDRALDGELMMTTLIGATNAAVVVDGQGRYRWWGGLGWITPSARARLSHDGEHVLILPVNVDGNDHTGLQRLRLDGTLEDTVVVEGQHHDFIEMSDGTLAFIVRSPRDIDGTVVAGDKIVEVAPDGTTTTIWDGWDWIPFDGEQPALLGEGWLHGNALAFDEASQTYTLSMYGIQALAHIDRATGELLWLMGTDDSDFVNEHGGTTIVDYGHQFDFVDGGLLVFENGDSTRQSSRAVEYEFDEADPVMRLRWSYEPDPSLYSFSLGDVERLDSGDTVVDFCANGVMVQVSPEGEEVWRMEGRLGAAFGYMSFLGPAGSF
ncbi:MAG: hypothetical protein D6798_04395 [Deltaproteobacteria bacterium]|nr:MAG: hypothetical protein D6798_04395 [Deltaproteobacteria bacterium]